MSYFKTITHTLRDMNLKKKKTKKNLHNEKFSSNFLKTTFSLL